MKEFLRVSRVMLKSKEICPYKDSCCFNEKPEMCYGALERDNQFVCNLDKLEFMYDRSMQGELNRGNSKVIIDCSKR